MRRPFLGYKASERFHIVLEHMAAVREVLLVNDIDPYEVDGGVDPD